jgi:hypothetical protein
MRRTVSVLSFSLVLLLAPSVFAQATRTWVSGVGDDANPCSRTAPCKTFAGAISKTAAGGEISVLDPGGFGAVNITKSMTINGYGQHSSILFSGTNGVIVNGAGIIVNLNDISFNGGTPVSPGLNGIRIIQAASVSVNNCDIFNFNNNGIIDERATPGILTVKNTRIHNSLGVGAGVGASRIGIRSQVSANKLTCDGCIIYGLEGASIGIFLNNGAQASIIRSTINSNSVAVSTAGAAQASLQDVAIFNQSDGLRVAAGTTIRCSECLITNNGDAYDLNGGTIITFGNNRINGNTGNDGTGATLDAEQ